MPPVSNTLQGFLTFLLVKLPRLWSDWRYARTTNIRLAQRLRREMRS
jgi:hypothetical protein